MAKVTIVLEDNDVHVDVTVHFEPEMKTDEPTLAQNTAKSLLVLMKALGGDD